MIDPAALWEFALIGLIAGFAAGYLGIGGGLIIVPALIYVFSRDPATAAISSHMAVATSLTTMLATSLSSIWAHQRRKAIRWDVFRKLLPGLLLGAALGAWAAYQVPTRLLAQICGVFAILAGLQLLFLKAKKGGHPLPGTAGSTPIGLAIGSVSSLVGIGGGSITAPWLMWHDVRAQTAVATAAACGYPIAVAGSAMFLGLSRSATQNLGYVHLPAAAGIAIAGVIAAPIGAWLVHKSPPHGVRRAFGIFLLLVGARLLLPAS